MPVGEKIFKVHQPLLIGAINGHIPIPQRLPSNWGSTTQASSSANCAKSKPRLLITRLIIREVPFSFLCSKVSSLIEEKVFVRQSEWISETTTSRVLFLKGKVKIVEVFLVFRPVHSAPRRNLKTASARFLSENVSNVFRPHCEREIWKSNNSGHLIFVSLSFY